MRNFGLWRFFSVNAVAYVIALCVGFGLLCGLIIPTLVWLLTLQFKWMSFNEWIGYVLLGFPIGILAAGMMTVHEWTRSSSASPIKKIVISVLTFALLMGGGTFVVKGIRLLFPIL